MTAIAIFAAQAVMNGQIQPCVDKSHVGSAALYSIPFKSQSQKPDNIAPIQINDIPQKSSTTDMKTQADLKKPQVTDHDRQKACEEDNTKTNNDKGKKPQIQPTPTKKINRWIAAIAIVAMTIGGGCAIYQHLYNNKSNSTSRIPETSVAYAARNLENLFKSAQQTFIHRNGKRMGASIDELGEHFTIGSNGTIIYREIWYARYGRPESDITPVDQQDDWERKALADPYRYAVLPVHGFESHELDDRTSVLVAIPVSEKNIPGLIVVAGPVRNDPADFLRKWPVKRIVTPEGCQLLRDRIDSNKPYDPEFAEELSSHFEEEF